MFIHTINFIINSIKIDYLKIDICFLVNFNQIIDCNFANFDYNQ